MLCAPMRGRLWRVAFTGAPRFMLPVHVMIAAGPTSVQNDIYVQATVRLLIFPEAATRHVL